MHYIPNGDLINLSCRNLLCSASVCFWLLTGPVFAEEIGGKPRVIDGDTLEISEIKIRLHGIDAPEVGQPGGKRSVDRMVSLVEGKFIRCQGSERDDYDRLVATCFVGGENINAEMVRRGQAWAFVKYSSIYRPLEKEARQKRLGIWQGSPEPPWEYRSQRWQVAKQKSPDGCPIKGNIAADGERIYHAPWSPWYDRTAVSMDKGERWFCNEAEAVRAGWRAPYWR